MDVINGGFGFEWTPETTVPEFEWRIPPKDTNGYIEIDRDVQLWRFKLGADGEETLELENKYLSEMTPTPSGMGISKLWVDCS